MLWDLPLFCLSSCPPPSRYHAPLPVYPFLYPILPACIHLTDLFGFCFLRQDPERVREITYGMIRKVTRTPVTVKCRIGVDDHDA